MPEKFLRQQRWKDMTRQEKLLHLKRLKSRCQPLGESGFVCFNVGVPRWNESLIDQWIAQVEADTTSSES